MRMSTSEIMSVSKVEDRIGFLLNMNQTSKTELDVADLIQGLKTLVFDENDLVSKSPMRTHEYSHCSKPYGFPQSSMSRVINGVTRVDESDDVSRNDPWRYSCLQQSLMTGRTEMPDVDIGDINQWLTMCSKNPQVIDDFINGCTEELSAKMDPNQFHDRSFMTQPQYKTDGVSICSNSSSQISSPVQSPSEHNVTSPESTSCEENSLYHSMSPIIPSLECINIKPVEETEEIDRLLCGGTSREENPSLNYINGNGLLDVAGSVSNIRTNVNSPSSETVSPNIGTLMLNLAADTFESTIDLSKFTGSLHPDTNIAYRAVEKEFLNDKLNPKAKQNAWTQISQLNIDALGKGDAEGDTQLMILLTKSDINLEYVYVMVERFLKENPEYLSPRNALNQDALLLAAVFQKREPVVASYIAEALIRGKQDVNKKYDEGDTLLHMLARRGDTHEKVIERLVHLRKLDNTPAFDVNKKNNRGYTPLHVACEVHKSEGVRSYQTVRVLLENGADCSEKEYIDENTPLHILINESCDAELLKILLEYTRKFRRKDGPEATTIANRQGNTSLHLACRRNTLDLRVQKEVVETLLQHGAMIQLKNINGCVPSVLVDASRKQEIKSSFHSFRQK